MFLALLASQLMAGGPSLAAEDEDLKSPITGIKYSLWVQQASGGWADKEQSEFKLVNDRFGIPGNPALIPYDGNELGIWVKLPHVEEKKYLALVVIKNVRTGEVRSLVRVMTDIGLGGSHFGSVNIEFEIPRFVIQKIVANGGLEEKQAQLIFAVAKDNHWSPQAISGAIHIVIPYR
jgi:hypothetical protein